MILKHLTGKYNCKWVQLYKEKTTLKIVQTKKRLTIWCWEDVHVTLVGATRKVQVYSSNTLICKGLKHMCSLIVLSLPIVCLMTRQVCFK